MNLLSSIKTLLFASILLNMMVLEVHSQEVSKIEPPNWWVGFENNSLELMIYGENINLLSPSINSELVELVSVQESPNPNYLWLNITIKQNVSAGEFNILWRKKGKKKIQSTNTYKLLERSSRKKGLEQSDLIYLIMPDRFSNGDKSNDHITGMNDQSLNRDSMFHRHGGDLTGIGNHLNHFQDLGVNALWLNPVLENNEKSESYHGYAATNLYKVDPRLGSNKKYKNLIDELHSKKMKIVQDVVYNHWGDQHWMIQDLPDSSFVNFWNEFQITSYRAPTLFDPYSSEIDKKIMTNGWFDHHMPDLNQRNPLLANYLIQNTIWWVEQFELDALRIDTYAYSDQVFMADLSNRLLQEFSDLDLFGETWVHGSSVQNWFTEGAHHGKGYSSGLQGVTDFQLFYAINDALMKPDGWAEGLNKIYYTLAKDYSYVSPESNVVFLDNHDVSRFYSMVNENLDKFKMGVGFIYTTRGIPCIYYGTEILMSNYADPDGKVREDFPGGWDADPIDHFLGSNLEGNAEEAYTFMKQLGKYRLKNPEIFNGDLVHFVPENNIYTYFRDGDQKRLMVIMNFNSKEQNLFLDRFSEMCSPYKNALNVLDGNEIPMANHMVLQPWSITILELQP